MTDVECRKAVAQDFDAIWEIIEFAKASRRLDGSAQWQDGYPNAQSIQQDIKKGYGYVLTAEEGILFYAALIFEIEPAYEAIEGKWLSTQAYAVIHRMAVSPKGKGKGLSELLLRKAEEICLSKGIHSIKIDTNYDNPAMLHLMDKLGYTYCGEVYFRGAARRAFEKVLS